MSDTIQSNQRKALEALLAGATVERAALEADVTERTLYRWLADDTFQAELQKRRDELLDFAVTAVTVGVVEAIENLRTIQRDDRIKASTRVSASKAILDTALRLREQREFARRLSDLEAALYVGQGVLP